MTEGLKSNLLFIQIPYNSAKSLRLACGNPPPFTREAESLRLALTRPTSLYKGGKIPPACLDEAHLPLQERRG